MRTVPTLLLSVVAVPALLVACDRGSEPKPATTGESTSAPSTPATASAAPGVPAMQPNGPASLPQERSIGAPETVALFDVMPTGVAVSQEGRVFVNFPRWGDPIPMSVAEVKNGQPAAYPDATWNPAQPGDPATTFVGVQSVAMDAKNRLWALDTGTVNRGKVVAGGAKLVGVDLATNRPFATIAFGADVALPTSYLNDVRFDLRRGKAGFAYISDSSSTGPNAIVVVDLDSKKAWRRLQDHPSVKAAPGFLAIVEGGPLYQTGPAAPGRTAARQPFTAGVDGIEVSPDGKLVYYSPLASRHLYSVSADALSDPNVPDAQVAATVKDLGEKGASDGLLMASDGRLFVTEYEGGAILRRETDGTLTPVVHDTAMMWPDSMSLGGDGFLYFTVNQLDRMPILHDGKDQRQKPFVLMRVQVGAAPVRAGR